MFTNQMFYKLSHASLPSKLGRVPETLSTNLKMRGRALSKLVG